MKNIKTLNLVIIGLLLLSVSSAFAQLKEPFRSRYSETIKGDITIIANNTVSLNRTLPYNDELSNNDLVLDYVDIDNDPTTFNSSSANLRNPDPSAVCLSIEKVFLYWAASDLGDIVNGVELDNQPNWNFFDVKLQLPGQTNYTTVRADDRIYRGRDEHFSNDPYICFKDITAEVTSLANPYGNYQIANVEGKIGSLSEHGQPNSSTGVSGGWQILFIYKSPDLNLKSISIFDGYAHVTRDRNSFPIDFNGFQTVPNGPVRADIAFGALEGDRGIAGDRLQISVANVFQDIEAPSRPANNFFNSRITIGQPGDDNFIDRNPASLNTLGFDSALFPLRNPGNSVIGNNQTSATFRLTSTGETYGLYLLGFAVEVFEPVLVPIVHTATPNPITPSDDPDANVVTYNTQMTNNGNDNAINISFTTTIPFGSELISPILGLPTGITPTYDPVTRVLTFTAENGLLDVGDTLNFNYQIRVNDRCTFLENGCSTSLESEMVGVFQGEINGDVQTTGSSSDTDVCGIGNDTPTTVQVNEPDAANWVTNPDDLNVTLECDDIEGLEDAQGLNPIADCPNLIPIKTAGPFVPDGTDCIINGTYTNTWSFTDACGRTIADFVQVITIQDTTPPDVSACVDALSETVECAGDVLNEENALAWHEANLLRLQGCGTDLCNPNIVFTTGDNYDWANYVPNTGDCTGGGSLTVIYTLMDNCGNLSAELPATYTIEDTTPPDVSACVDALSETAECAGDVLNEENALAWHEANLLRLQGCAEDLCSPDIVFTPNDDYDWANYVPNTGDCTGGGSLTVIYTLMDNCGNLSAELPATYTIEDTTPPDVSACVDALSETVECAGDVLNEENALAWHEANLIRLQGCAEDLCSPDIVFTPNDDYDWANYVPNTGDCTGGGSLTVVYTLTDNCGNLSAELPATYTIEDTTPPNVSACVGTLSETAECAGDVLNEENALAWHEANLLRLQGCAEDLCSPDTIFTPNDNYDWANYVPNTGDCTGGGSLTVIYTLMDNCGNLSAELPATYTIEDTTPPDVSACVGALSETAECAGDVINEQNALAWHEANLLRLQGCAEDLCSPDIVFTPNDDYDWANYVPNTGDCTGGGSLTVVYTLTDNCGNISKELPATYTIEDTTPPDVSVCVGALNETAECSGGGGNEATALAWHEANLLRLQGCAEDLCSPDIVFATSDNYDWANFEPNTGSCTGGGSLTVNYTVTDNCGFESAPIIATLTLEDTTPPNVEVCASTLDATEECAGEDGNADIALAWHQKNLDRLLLCATDECNPDAKFETNDNYDWANFEPNTGDCTSGGTLTVVYTVADDCGFVSDDIMATLILEDTTGPQLVTSIQSTLDVVCTEVPEIPELEFVDGCTDDEITLEFEEVNGDLGDGSDYQVIRTWTVTDICDNTKVYEQTINVTNETLSNQASREACFDDGPIDLFSFVPNDTDRTGDWVIVSTINDNDDIEIIDGVFDPLELDQEEDLGDYVFSYTVTKGFCLENTEVTITLNDECFPLACGLEDFSVTKAITPNGDEYNQFFQVTSVKDCGFDINLTIFNRYGAIVYQNENYQNDWSADTLNSSLGSANKLPNGTYYYVIVLEDSGFKPLSGPLFIGTDNR